MKQNTVIPKWIIIEKESKIEHKNQIEGEWKSLKRNIDYQKHLIKYILFLQYTTKTKQVESFLSNHFI